MENAFLVIIKGERLCYINNIIVEEFLPAGRLAGPVTYTVR